MKRPNIFTDLQGYQPLKPGHYRDVMFFKLEVAPERAVLGKSGIMLGHAKQGISQEDFGQMGVLYCGLFGGGGDPNKYYEGVNANNIVPKAEDFVDVPFRLLSAAIVGGESWKASDFRDAKMLKKSVQMLHGVPVFTEHEHELDNISGIVVNPYWQEETVVDGITIPAGINGTIRLDAKSNPKLVRNVLMGAVFSNSVGVYFDWKPSHTFEEPDEFFYKIGTFDEEGEMITRVATKINAYYESSLVWMGADPFAKALNTEGNVERPDVTAIYYDKADPNEKTKYEGQKVFCIDGNINSGLLSLSKQGLKKNSTTPPKKTTGMNKKLLAAFLAAFAGSLKLSFTVAPEDGELTEAQQEEVISKLPELVLKSEVPTEKVEPEVEEAATFAKGLKTVNGKNEFVDFKLEGQSPDKVVVIPRAILEAKNEEIKSLSATKKQMESLTKAKREDAIRLYKLSIGDKTPNDNIIAIINRSEGVELDAFVEQYGGNATTEFGAICTHCNSSDHIEMRSSRPSQEDVIDRDSSTTPVADITRSHNSRGVFGN